MRTGYSLGLSLVLLASAASVAVAQDGVTVESRLLPAPQLRAEFGDAWYVQTRGRFEMDFVHIDDDQASHTGGIYDRRSRIGLELGYGEYWSATAEMDFVKEDEGQYTDLVLEYHNQRDTKLQFGHFKEYFGMERTDSSANALFVERAAIDVFTPQRNLGVQGMRYNKRGTASLGIFTDSLQTNTNKDDVAVTSRVTYSWPLAEHSLLHLGGAGSYRKMEQVGFSATPADSAATNVDAVSTGTLYDVDTMLLGGLEAGYSWKNTLLRGEYMTAHLDRSTAADATLDGWYAQASWVLTGESYQYSVAKDALFLPVRPARPFSLKANTWGAWELGARYQVLSLTDGSISGGDMRVMSGGLNWYPNSNWRVSSELSYVTTDAEAVTPHDDPIVAAMRVRVAF